MSKVNKLRKKTSLVPKTGTEGSSAQAKRLTGFGPAKEPAVQT
jgi:hypothetical protein